MSVLKAIGQSFLEPDIAIFKQNVEALEHLNAKWKLYHKVVFVQNLLAEFLSVLLQVMALQFQIELKHFNFGGSFTVG